MAEDDESESSVQAEIFLNEIQADMQILQFILLEIVATSLKDDPKCREVLAVLQKGRELSP
jgi:hypothetical protein